MLFFLNEIARFFVTLRKNTCQYFIYVKINRLILTNWLIFDWRMLDPRITTPGPGPCKRDDIWPFRRSRPALRGAWPAALRTAPASKAASLTACNWQAASTPGIASRSRPRRCAHCAGANRAPAPAWPEQLIEFGDRVALARENAAQRNFHDVPAHFAAQGATVPRLTRD